MLREIAFVGAVGVGVALLVFALCPMTCARGSTLAYESHNAITVKAVAALAKQQVDMGVRWTEGNPLKEETRMFFEILPDGTKSPLVLYDRPKGPLGIVARMSGRDKEGMVWAVTASGEAIKIAPID